MDCCDGASESERQIPDDGVWYASPPAISSLIASEEEAAGLNRLGEATTNRPKNESGNGALGFNRQGGCLTRKFEAAVQMQARLLQKLGREAEILGTIHAPEPELFFIALEKGECLFEFLHGPVKGRGEEENGQIPSMAGVLNPNSNTIFAGLIFFDAATVGVSNAG